MNRSLTRKGAAGLLGRLCLLSAGVPGVSGCEPPTVAVVDPAETAIHLALDTLNVEVQAVWVRVSAVPAYRQDLVLTWELAAETANPFWRPKVIRKSGARSFESPDTARIWGNIGRAYDFRLAVTGRGTHGGFVTDTLRIRAPTCPNPRRPHLLCNVRPRGGRGPGLRSS